MAISYQSDTSPMYVGRLAPDELPLWLQPINDNQWGELVLAKTLSDIDPEDDVLINPSFPGVSVWHANVGMSSMMSAWCGLCTDQINSVLWWPLQEGHDDGASNAPFKMDLSVDVPEAVMIRNPTGAIGNEGILDDGLESTGVYFDGRLRSIHSYNKPVFVDGDAPWIAIQGGVYKDAAIGFEAPFRIDPITGEHTKGADIPKVGASSASGSCYDSTRHAIWYLGAGLGFFSKYDITGDSWTDFISLNQFGGGNGMIYLPDHDAILIIADSAAQPSNIGIYDIATNTHFPITISGSLSAGLTLAGSCQPQYSQQGQFVALWNNQSSTTEISTLSIPADPLNDTWVASTLPVDVGNSVTPSTGQTNGTFGRFFYLPNFNVFGVINDITENIYIFKVGS